jgi:hypothetical protein
MKKGTETQQTYTADNGGPRSCRLTLHVKMHNIIYGKQLSDKNKKEILSTSSHSAHSVCEARICSVPFPKVNFDGTRRRPPHVVVLFECYDFPYMGLDHTHGVTSDCALLQKHHCGNRHNHLQCYNTPRLSHHPSAG